MSNIGRDRSDTAEAGFTLVEVLAVLAIIALTAALAMPSPAGSRHHHALKASAIELASALKSARAAAIRTNSEQTLTIDTSLRSIMSEGRAPVRLASANVALELLTIRSEEIGPSTGRLRFYPDGSSTGGRVVLRLGQREAAVIVDWMTGGTRVDLPR